MSHPAIGRFFSIRHALIAVGIGGGGLICGAIVAYRYFDAHRIPIMLVLVAVGLLILAPVYFVAEAFPQGCRACRRAFASKLATFPAGWKEVVQRFLSTPDQATWHQLCYAPVHDQSERATLMIHHCDGCGRVGKAKLVTEVARDGGWATRDFCEERVVESPMLTWLTQLADLRAGTTPPGQGGR